LKTWWRKIAKIVKKNPSASREYSWPGIRLSETLLGKTSSYPNLEGLRFEVHVGDAHAWWINVHFSDFCLWWETF
jgi:hypothetical protein